MGILTKEVEVKPSGRMIQYYKDRGYDAKWRESIIVKIEDLPLRSDKLVDTQCDYCGKLKPPEKYSTYNTHTKNGIEKCCCIDCAYRKRDELMIKKYGVTSPAKLEEVRKHMEETFLQRYGVRNPMQNPKVKEKLNETLCKNGSVCTSKQQRYICSLYGGEINYPIKYYSVDICFPEEKLCIEYDGGFHNGSVKIGQLTQEEFDQKERIRDKVIKNEGYKIMRIISQNDYLPKNEILLQMLEYTRQYFFTTSHTWISWDIDNFLLINAEDKEGVYFDYGKLYMIKNSVLVA